MSLERKGVVEYEFLQGKTQKVCIFLPGAGPTNRGNNDEFVELGRRNYDMVFIHGGYAGISSFDEEEISMNMTRSTLAEVASSFEDISLIVGHSVGTLHAMNLKDDLKSELTPDVVLVNPGLYKQTPRKVIDRALLKLVKRMNEPVRRQLITGIGRLRGLRKTSETLSDLVEEMGPSYLTALEQAIGFTTDEERVRGLLQDSLVILGDRDEVFNIFGDPNLITSAERVVIFRGDHHLTTEQPQKVWDEVIRFSDKATR